MANGRAFILLSLLQWCEAQNGNPTESWYSSNTISKDDGYTPKPISEIFSQDIQTFSTINPIVVLPSSTEAPISANDATIVSSEDKSSSSTSFLPLYSSTALPFTFPIAALNSPIAKDLNSISIQSVQPLNLPVSTSPPPLPIKPNPLQPVVNVQPNSIPSNVPQIYLLPINYLPQQSVNVIPSNQLNGVTITPNSTPNLATSSPIVQNSPVVTATPIGLTSGGVIVSSTQVTLPPNGQVVSSPISQVSPALTINPALSPLAQGNPVASVNLTPSPLAQVSPAVAFNPALSPLAQGNQVVAVNPTLAHLAQISPAVVYNPALSPLAQGNQVVAVNPTPAPLAQISPAVAVNPALPLAQASPVLPCANNTNPLVRIRVTSPRGVPPNIAINVPTRGVRGQGTQRPRNNRNNRRNVDDCVRECGNGRNPICAAPLGLRPIDSQSLKGFPSDCHMACHNSFRRTRFEKVTDGRCGRLRDRIRPVGNNGRLRASDLVRNQYKIVNNIGDMLYDFSPL